MVQSVIISIFLPPRVKEGFIASYVLELFQSSGEDLNTYVMSVVAAAEILGYTGLESQLVDRMVENLHPKVKSYLLFASKPESVRYLFSLATTVAEAVAVEEQRKQLFAAVKPGPAPPAGCE
jgi:C4-dicarboxylate transporter